MKEKIIRVTAKIISKDGAKAASIRAICAKAGVKAPTIYYYFKNRDELLNQVTSMAFEKNVERRDIVKQSTGCLNNLKLMWDEYIDFAIHEPDLFAVMIASITRGTIPDRGRACFERTLSQFRIAAEKQILRKDAHESALIFQASAQGVATLAVSLLDRRLALKISRETKKLILAGLFTSDAEMD